MPARRLNAPNSSFPRWTIGTAPERWQGQTRSASGLAFTGGEAFCGAIGDEARLEYTVLGDTVNVAARLEQLTKEIQWPVLASQDAIDAAGTASDRGQWHALESIPLRGRTALTPIFAMGNPQSS